MNSFCELFRSARDGFSSDSLAFSFIVPKSICEEGKHCLLNCLPVQGLGHWLWGDGHTTLSLGSKARGYWAELLRAFTSTFGRLSFSQKERVELIKTPELWDMGVSTHWPTERKWALQPDQKDPNSNPAVFLFLFVFLLFVFLKRVGPRQVTGPSYVLVSLCTIWEWRPLHHRPNKSLNAIRAVKYIVPHACVAASA